VVPLGESLLALNDLALPKGAEGRTGTMSEIVHDLCQRTTELFEGEVPH
jgi:hypothetical protein